MRHWHFVRNQARSFQPEHGRRTPRHDSRKPERMRANHREAARQTPTFALDAVGIEQRAVIIGPLKCFGFLFHDANVGVRNVEFVLSIVIRDPFQQSLSDPERNWDEPMKDDCVSDRQRQNDQERAANNCQRIAPSSFALDQNRNSGREKECQEHRVCSEPAGDSDQRACDDEVNETRILDCAGEKIECEQNRQH